MQVEEIVKSKKEKHLRYIFDDGSTISKDTGELLCRFLNAEWDDFSYLYEAAQETGLTVFHESLNLQFTQLDPSLRNCLDCIFPVNFENMRTLKKTIDLIKFIKAHTLNDTVSYHSFHCILTHFYGYIPPLPITQKKSTNMFSFLDALIKDLKLAKDKISRLLKDVKPFKEKNILLTQKVTNDLKDLMATVLENNDKRFNSQHQRIDNFLDSFFDAYIEELKNHIPLLFSDTSDQCIEKICQTTDPEELNLINSRSTFSAIEKLCVENNVTYMDKHIFLNLLYQDIEPSYTGKAPKIYYLHNSFDLICHAVLYYFKDNTAPIKRCEFCKKFFPRHINSQKVCNDCKPIAYKMKAKKWKDIFGIDLLRLTKNIYRRLCYQGRGRDSKYCKLKYINYVPSKDKAKKETQSEILVRELKRLAIDLHRVATIIYEEYHNYNDAEIQKFYVESVLAWAKKIDEYYRLDNVRQLIKNAKSIDKEKHVVKITFFDFDVINIIEEEREIIL